MSNLEYQLNWEQIFGSQSFRGSIYYLPSETSAIIIQYDPDFKISALIPPTTRDININYKGYANTRKHKSSFLIWSHLSYLKSDCEPSIIFPKIFDTRVPSFSSGFYGEAPFSITFDQNGYPVINPSSPQSKPIIDNTKERQEILNSLSHFPWCYCFWCNNTAFRLNRITNLFYLYGVDTSTEEEIMAQPYRLNNVYADARCCFRKNASAKNSPKNLKQAHTRFWMDYFSDEFLPKPFHTNCLLKRHDYSSSHFDNIDALRYCGCECCSKMCGCSCRCNLPEVFADFIANYQPSEAWENYTRVICGNQFISFPKSADAVFISNDLELLEILPKTYRKKSPKFSEQFIIGSASQKEQNWEIDLIGQKFSLNNSQISVVE